MLDRDGFRNPIASLVFVTDYRSPVDDVRFALRHIAGFDEILAMPGFEHVDEGLVDGLLDEAGR
jgi:hypothetical protein